MVSLNDKLKPKHLFYGLVVLLTATAVTAVLLSLLLSRNGEQTAAASLDDIIETGLLNGADGELYYEQVLRKWQKEGLSAATAPFSLEAASPSASSGSGDIGIGEYEGLDQVLIWQGGSSGWVEYRFDVPAEGLYRLEVTYNPIKGEAFTNPIIWDVTLDGLHPFREASSTILYRTWKDSRPIMKNDEGDEIRPKSQDISGWTTKQLTDSTGAYAEPLLWPLTKGEHTLRLEGAEPVAVAALRFVPPEELPPYSQVAADYPPVSAISANELTIQAEDLTSKNDTSIKLFSDKDPRTVPLAKGTITYNTVGGFRWIERAQEITWTFEVPESGLYKLAVRALQNQTANKASFRTIRLDGEIPFRELASYRFPYAPGWRGIELAGQDGEPFQFYLEKGSHSLSMAVTHAPLQETLLSIEALTGLLDLIDQDLRSLTGGVVDKNRTWRVHEELPDLTNQLRQAMGYMQRLSQTVRAVNGRKDGISQGFDTSSKDIRDLLEKEDDIPYYADQITAMKEKINLYMDSLLKQPLQLDEIHIAPVDQPFSDMEASWLAKAAGTIANFKYSFDDRNSLSNLDSRVLNVWVQRGRDYVDQLQQLTDELFTPESGIKVKVNLLPNPQMLLMSNAAGLQPDVALGLTQDLPVDYAIRGSLVDLSEFSDFEQLYNRFSPGSWLPFYYNKGYYAIPETQSFQVLYYRKDIMKQLGLNIPETWEQVYDLLPTLQENFMNFYLNPKELSTFFYQNGTDFYEADGLKTSLSSPDGFKAFRHWTELFSIYALEREVPSFYQHFRRGTMPIGISDYNMYVQLSAAAPELNNRWGIALIPGVRQEDGSIVRWAGGGQRTGVIFRESSKKEQAWEFLKWWVSTETQVQYGTDIEAVNGVAFRWNTSNVEAFSKLPWKREDANVILQQWAWYKDIPNLPGGYFLSRELNNAWIRTVVDGMNERSSLELAIIDIDRELRRKQQEFGFIDGNGQTVRTMDLPNVNKPWEGTKPYVK